MNKPLFKNLICIDPLGFTYGSAGAFLSPENLVGRSGSKFPPDAATLAGLMFSTHRARGQSEGEQYEFSRSLYVAGPFWSTKREPRRLFVPIPWTKIVSSEGWDEWHLVERKGRLTWYRDPKKRDLEPSYSWFPIDDWHKSARLIQSYANNIRTRGQSVLDPPWQYSACLHPKMTLSERCTTEENGLFLENAVQIEEGFHLVYLSSHSLESDWYRFGGENHLAAISSLPMQPDWAIARLLQQPIDRAFAYITPAVWGSNRLSYRYPQHADFPWDDKALMLTDKPVPYRHSSGGRLGRGRYAVPAGSVCVLGRSLGIAWQDWPQEWFPKEGYPLKHVGSGLCLPLQIQGLSELKGAA